MKPHEIAIAARVRTSVDNTGETYTTAATRYRWICSCGRIGSWTPIRHVAASSGARHLRHANTKRPS